MWFVQMDPDVATGLCCHLVALTTATVVRKELQLQSYNMEKQLSTSALH